MDYVEWARRNKKVIAEKIIRETRGSAKPSGAPIALFMAGIPGAGKTEFLDRFIGVAPQDVFVRIDLDTIVTKIQGYSPEKYYDFRGAANPILERVLDKALKKGLNFALDGTFAHKNAVSNIGRALDHGFMVVLFYIYQDPKVAWEVTKAREKVTKRGVESEGFIHTCVEVPKNVQKALDTYAGRLSAVGVIKNDLNEYTFKRNITNIDEITPVMYTEDELRKGIK